MKPRDLIPPLAVLGVVTAFLLWPSGASAAAVATATLLPGGRILSRFGTRGSGFHYGIDISAPIGTPIYAPLAGVVISAYSDGEVSGYGNVVTMRVGDIGFLFSHMDSMAVRRGDVVAAGQIVGRVGRTNSTSAGFHTSGPHLHFEVIIPAAGSDIDRLLAHYTGSTPPRVDPEAWAVAHGVRLVG